MPKHDTRFITTLDIPVIQQYLQGMIPWRQLELSHGKIDLLYDAVYQSLVWHASWRVAAIEAKRHVVTYVSWWDHFKSRWFPTWAKARWPVRTRVWTAIRLLPGIPLPPYDRNEVITFKELH